MDIRTFIGDRSFYKKVFTIAVPIMIQNGITNFVALLDNIMVGQLGTAQMSGTAVINQLLFVFNLCIFGILAGPGIYGAQFFGKGSSEGVRTSNTNSPPGQSARYTPAKVLATSCSCVR